MPNPEVICPMTGEACVYNARAYDRQADYFTDLAKALNRFNPSRGKQFQIQADYLRDRAEQKASESPCRICPNGADFSR